MDLTANRINKEFKSLINSKNPYILAKPQPDNIFMWHFCLHGLSFPYQKGVYYGIMTLPQDYPFKPPSIEFITPNGRFETNKKICTSFTNYHPQKWSPVWSIQKMLMGLISFMYQKQRTQGGIQSSSGEKQRLAARSRQYNKLSKQFMRFFGQYAQLLRLDQKLQQSFHQVEQVKQKNRDIVFPVLVVFSIAIITYLFLYNKK